MSLLIVVSGCSSHQSSDEDSTVCTRVDSAAKFSVVLIEASPGATSAAIEDCKQGDASACAAVPIATPFIFVTGVLTAPVFFLIGLGSEDLERNICGPSGQKYHSEDSIVVDYALEPTRTWKGLCQQADAGDGAARSAIAFHYREGWEPVNVDKVKAYQWFALAVESGSEQSKVYRDQISAELTEDQISYAERLVGSWQPGDCRREVETLTDWHQVCLLAMREDARAQYELGVFFEYGKRPVEQDIAEAYLWYSLAASRGYGSAVLVGEDSRYVTKLDVLRGKIAEDRIGAVERDIAEWAPDTTYCAKWPQVSSSRRY